jgi:drug/metabolite transporter (DMT)-like permease
MRYSTGVILVFIAGILWSAMGLAIRLVEQADTWQVLFWRSLGMAPVLLLFIAWRSGGQVMGRMRAAGRVGLLGGFGLVLAFGGAIYAIQTTTIANAVFLFAASPFFAAVLGKLVLGEAVRRATWAALCLAIVGMGLMVREGLAMGALDGNIAAVLSALGFALFTVTLRRGKLGDMMPAVVMGAGLSALTGLGILLAKGSTPMVPAQDIAISLAMGAGLLACGMVLYTLGSRVVPAAELTLLSLIEVILAPIWVFALLGETASSGTFLGGSFVLAAIVGNAVSGAWGAAARRRNLSHG